MNEFKFPTEVVELPSKGLVYPKDHILRSGKVEMKYMTAKEEDILSNQNFISKGIVLDKLLESLTLGEIDIKDLIVGDKNAIFIAARVLGYGKDYSFKYDEKEYNVDAVEYLEHYSLYTTNCIISFPAKKTLFTGKRFAT